MATVGNPKRGMFEGKAAYQRRRQEELSKAVTEQQRPPSDEVDTQGRPVNPKRPKFGYRGYDPAREPQKQSVLEKVKYGQDQGRPGSRAIRQQAEQSLAEKGVSAAEFKAELGKLNKGSSNYEEQRKALFARRQLGKRAGK